MTALGGWSDAQEGADRDGRSAVKWLGVAAEWATEWVSGLTRRCRTSVLTVTGFALISYAGWGVSRPLGYAMAGVSLLVIEFLSGDPDEPDR